MKVLHVVPGTPFGGMQLVVCDLAYEQKRQGIDVVVLVIYESRKMSERLERDGIPYCIVPGQRPSFRGVAAYSSFITQSNADLIHLHSGLLWADIVGLARKRCPWLLHAHSYPSSDGSVKSLVKCSVERNLADALIGVSNSVSQAHSKLMSPGAPIFTVYNGVSIQTDVGYNPVGCTAGTATFGMATRFAPDKGVFEFIEVADRISQQLPKARYMLAGDGPLLNEARERVKSLGLQESFEFCGFVGNIQQFWSRVDIALFTGPREPFGLRLVEPMLLGIPVVAYLSGAGSDEIIQADHNALVANWGDPKTLASQAVLLSRDPELRSALSEQARDTARKRFSIEEMTKNVAGIYVQVCAQSDRSCPQRKALTI